MKDKDPIAKELNDIKWVLLSIVLVLWCILIAQTCSAQDKWWKLDKKDIWASSTMFVAGWADKN